MLPIDLFLAKIVGGTAIKTPPTSTDRQKLDNFLTVAKIKDPHKRNVFVTLWELFQAYPSLPLREIADLVLQAKLETCHIEIPFDDPEKTIVVKAKPGRGLLIQIKRARTCLFERLV